MDEIEVGEVFTITDESEEEHTVEVLARLTLEETDFIAVSFIEDIEKESDENIDIFFLKIDNEGELAAIETDEEFNKVSEAFDAILEAEEEE